MFRLVTKGTQWFPSQEDMVMIHRHTIATMCLQMCDMFIPIGIGHSL
jgi:hypothetical protein